MDVMDSTSRIWHRSNGTSWSFVGCEMFASGFQIDIKETRATEAEVLGVVFAGRGHPAGLDLSPTMRVDCVRWNVTWQNGATHAVIAAMRPVVAKYYNAQYRSGWQNPSSSDGKRFAERKWQNTKQLCLGNRTPGDIAELGSGPYEIRNIGFAWFGAVGGPKDLQLQTRPYSKSKDFNDAIRWFLERGLSLKQALGMNKMHMSKLNQEAIAHAVAIFGEIASTNLYVGGAVPAALEMERKIFGSIRDNPINPLTPSAYGFGDAISSFLNLGGIEEKINQLGARQTVKVQMLSVL